ncbi:BrxA/BrxB family bacilliredoxin [bacterium]|nr:BrxA/BrxB family bacilliredoxin [bacterium]
MKISMYDPNITDRMRKELTDAGVQELRTPEEVDKALKNMAGTAMVVVNSVCGCAAGGARPGVVMSLKSPKRPEKIYTVFAGQDKEATEQARTYFIGYPPSSPAVAILKDGKVVHMMPRHEIEGRSADEIANSLAKAYEKI